jgi:hypothetical protein
MTGQLEEEKMQVYVRSYIQLLYKARPETSTCNLCTDLFGHLQDVKGN